MPPEPRLATYVDRDQDADGSKEIFGRDIATDGFLNALFRHGASGDYTVLRPPAPDDGSAESQPPWQRAAAARADIRIRYECTSGIRRGSYGIAPRVFHDCDGDLQIATSLRSLTHGSYPVTATPHVLSYAGLSHSWILRLMMMDVRRFDSLICTSKAAKQGLWNLFQWVGDELDRAHGFCPKYKGRLEVIPLGVDTQVFAPRDKAASRRKLGLPLDAFVIGWVGRLSFSDKADLLPLLEAFQRITVANPSRKIVLMLAGGGEAVFEDAVREHATALRVHSGINFMTPLMPEHRHQVFNAFDVFVSPADSVQETFGLTPIEAMASGIPQVVSDWSGYRDTVRDGETGFLVPTVWGAVDSRARFLGNLYEDIDMVDHLLSAQSVVVDVDRFTASIQALIDNEELRHRMGGASRARALAHYDWRHVIRCHEDLWEELSAEARMSPSVVARRDDYSAPPLSRVLGHFASRLCGPEDVWEVTEAGMDVVRGRREVPYRLDRFEILSRPFLLDALTALGRKPMSGIVLAEETRGEPEETLRHLLWLFKHGLARCRLPDFAISGR